MPGDSTLSLGYNRLMYIRLTTLIFILFASTAQLFGQIQPPNYDFSLDSLKVFFPNSNLAQMSAAHGAFEEVEKKGNTRLLRFNVAHIRYRFPVYVQVDKEDTPLEFFARLPNYFLHDLFHQSIINRFEKQNHFLNKNGTAVYKWDDREGMNMTYSATCTITCFPIFLHGQKTQLPEGFESIAAKMRDSQTR